MAKQTKGTEEKKAFAWDSEVTIKVIEVSEKEKHEIKICTLKGKTFLVDTKLAYFQKDGWKPVKNSTMEMSIFDAVVDAVAEYKLNSAFAGSGITIEEKPKKSRAKASSEEGTLKGKKTAPAEEKPKRTRKTKAE